MRASQMVLATLAPPAYRYGCTYAKTPFDLRSLTQATRVAVSCRLHMSNTLRELDGSELASPAPHAQTLLTRPTAHSSSSSLCQCHRARSLRSVRPHRTLNIV